MKWNIDVCSVGKTPRFREPSPLMGMRDLVALDWLMAQGPPLGTSEILDPWLPSWLSELQNRTVDKPSAIQTWMLNNQSLQFNELSMTLMKTTYKLLKFCTSGSWCLFLFCGIFCVFFSLFFIIFLFLFLLTSNINR